MSEAEYTPEFIETLNAWEQKQPLTAEFVFDLPPGDTRKADKVGVLMYQAVLILQDHPGLDFSRIKAVTFTMDVHRTGDELEKITGHDLPQYRNAAARLDAFHVNLGPGQILIITDELANASISPRIATRLAAWELLRSELARSVAVARLADAGLAAARPGAAVQWDAFARHAWTEHFCGFHATVEGLQTDMARQRLRESLEQDPAALAQALRSFARDRDLTELVGRAEGCARGVFEAMCEVIGQQAALGQPLVETDPQLETLIRAHALIPVWDGLRAALAAAGHVPAIWNGEAPWQALIALGQQWLGRQGLQYDDSGTVITVELAPESDGETP